MSKKHRIQWLKKALHMSTPILADPKLPERPSSAPMQTNPDNSPNEAVTTHPNGITQVVRNFFGGGTRAQDTVLAIAIVVIVLQTILLWGAYKHQDTQGWVAEYELHHFESTEFSELKARVDTNAALIQAFGIANEVTYGRRRNNHSEQRNKDGGN